MANGFSLKAAVAVLALLGVAATAGAGEHRRKLDLISPLLIHGGAQALDHFSTQAALARGGVEVGPVASRVGPNAARFIGGAAFLGADILAQKKGPKWLKWVVRGASVGVASYAAIHNSRVGRRP